MRGFVINNTGSARHIFKRTVYPGQTVPLEQVYGLLKAHVPEGETFVDWLESYLPNGWEVSVLEEGAENREFLTAVPVVHETEDSALREFYAKETNREPLSDEDDRPSIEFATPRTIDKLTARDLYNLRVKDNPKRIINQITSIHKLRRALTLCKNDSRKTMLTKIIRARIRKLGDTDS